VLRSRDSPMRTNEFVGSDAPRLHRKYNRGYIGSQLRDAFALGANFGIVPTNRDGSLRDGHPEKARLLSLSLSLSPFLFSRQHTCVSVEIERKGGKPLRNARTVLPRSEKDPR